MQIKKRKLRDLPVWPPIWACRSPVHAKEGVLKNVEVIAGTEFLRIDVEQGRQIHPGVMLTEAEVHTILLRKLQENIGRPLAEIANLEIEF